MINIYDVFWEGKAVGTASFEKEGLYWKIHCCCDIPDDIPYQVTLKAGEEIDMGLLVREKSGFCLTKRIAMKRIGDIQPSFTATPRAQKASDNFLCITSDEPFSHIEKIKDSKLEERDEQVGIIIAQEDPNPQIPDSDPSPESPDESAPEEFDHSDL